MTTIRIRGDGREARAIAEGRLASKHVHIRTVFVVRDADGEDIGERDYVFSSTMGR